jgi:hypothetical protein
MAFVASAGPVTSGFVLVRLRRPETNSEDGGRTGLQAIDSLVLALGLIVLGDDGGNTRPTPASAISQSPENAKRLGEGVLRATSLANTRHGRGRAVNLPMINSELELLCCRLERGARQAGLSQRKYY